MPNKLIKAAKLECNVDLTHRVSSIAFQESDGESAEIWLSGPDVFFLLGELERMVRENPEMQTWKTTHRPN